MIREEAIEWLNRELKVWEKDCLSKHPIKEALSVAIKALEQEPILDKIRAEIMSLDYIDEDKYEGTSISPMIYRDDVLEIIDKYKGESEVEE